MSRLDKAKWVGAALLGAMGLIVVLQNTDSVETRFLTMSFSLPRAVLLGGTFLAGFSVGLIVAVALVRRRAKRDGQGSEAAA